MPNYFPNKKNHKHQFFMKKHQSKFSQFKKGRLDDFSPIINRAYKLASYAHHGQKRKSGEDYMTHPVSIMNYLRSMDVKEDILISALLHDVLEDTSINIKDLEELFNKRISYIVYFLSKDDLKHFKNKDQRRLVYFDKLEAGFCFDYSIYLVKLVDRLHNISTLSFFSKEKKVRVVKENITVFIPLFKKYLSVVPKKFKKHCVKIIKDIEEMIHDNIII